MKWVEKNFDQKIYGADVGNDVENNFGEINSDTDCETDENSDYVFYKDLQELAFS